MTRGDDAHVGTAHQLTCVAIGGRAILIGGPPQIGKSSLALALIDRGAELVGDDSVLLVLRDGILEARPHPATRGLIEICNLGLLPMPVCDRAAVALVVTLDEYAPRWIEAAEQIIIENLPLPHVTLWPQAPNLPIKVEMALRHYGLCGP